MSRYFVSSSEDLLFSLHVFLSIQVVINLTLFDFEESRQTDT